MKKGMKPGYFVRGNFVAYGSELDTQLKLERKAETQIDPTKPSRTEKKAQADAMQKLGEELLGLRADLLADLTLSDDLNAAILEWKRLKSFEAKRRHLQLVGKLMRRLEEDQITSIHAALKAQAKGVARKTVKKESE